MRIYFNIVEQNNTIYFFRAKKCFIYKSGDRHPVKNLARQDGRKRFYEVKILQLTYFTLLLSEEIV